MVKVFKKILIWAVALIMIMFISLWTLSTISNMNIGRPFTDAVRYGFADVVNGIGELFGVKAGRDHIVLDFKNGSIGFENTHRNW